MATKRGSATTLRPNRRYIATHDANGKSVYAESPDQEYRLNPPFGGIARSFALEKVPVNFQDEADIKNYRGTKSTASYRERHIVVPGGGVNLVVCDLSPGGESALHQTKSIDFSICVVGQIDHELDSGERVTLLPGVGIQTSSVGAGLTGCRIISYNVAQCTSGSTTPRPSRQDSWLSLCQQMITRYPGLGRCWRRCTCPPRPNCEYFTVASNQASESFGSVDVQRIGTNA